MNRYNEDLDPSVMPKIWLIIIVLTITAILLCLN
jgi:hypothetical protein